jgi:hypothetical protein
MIPGGDTVQDPLPGWEHRQGPEILRVRAFFVRKIYPGTRGFVSEKKFRGFSGRKIQKISL